MLRESAKAVKKRQRRQRFRLVSYDTSDYLSHLCCCHGFIACGPAKTDKEFKSEDQALLLLWKCSHARSVEAGLKVRLAIRSASCREKNFGVPSFSVSTCKRADSSNYRQRTFMSRATGPLSPFRVWNCTVSPSLKSSI